MNVTPAYQKDSDMSPEEAFKILKDDKRNWEEVLGAVWFIDKNGTLCQRVFKMWQTTKIIRHEHLRRSM